MEKYGIDLQNKGKIIYIENNIWIKKMMNLIQIVRMIMNMTLIIRIIRKRKEKEKILINMNKIIMKYKINKKE